MRRFGYLVLVAWLGSSLTLSARGDVKLPAIIGSNMVLQADMPLPIWGWASPGEEVTVTLGTAKVSTKAGPEGKWQLKLPPQKASDKPIEVTVAGKNTLLLKNVLIGEVWGGSGQSNMQWSVDRSTNKDEELKSAKYPLIRLFLVPNRLSAHPLEDVDAHWVECTPETVPGFSAVLYFFGREIHKVEKVPVGLINVSWGGSRIESWITHDGYASHPELKKELDDYNKLKNDRVAVMAARKQLLPQAKAWVAAAEKALSEGKEIPDGPSIPADPLNQYSSYSGMYNGMVHAITPYAIRGFLWYQGESNRGMGMHYHELMKGLIADWRKIWGEGDFPFLFAQTGSVSLRQQRHVVARNLEAQTATLAIPNTGMAVTTDITTINDIHPPNKQDVGKRLALWCARQHVRGVICPYSGPLFDSMSVEGDKIRVKFKHAAPGLVARDGKPLSWFSIAG